LENHATSDHQNRGVSLKSETCSSLVLISTRQHCDCWGGEAGLLGSPRGYALAKYCNKSKLLLKPNSGEILPGNCKFICDSTSTYKLAKLKHEVLKSDFQRKKR